MRQPVRFAHRNLVWGESLEDVWALYRVETRSYAGLTRAGKEELLGVIAAFAATIEADFSLLRVTRPWSLEAYRRGAELLLDTRHGHRERFAAYLESHEHELGRRSTSRPEVYVCVRLGRATGSLVGQAVDAARVGRRDPLGGVRRLLALDDPRGISQRRLDALLVEEGRAHGRIAEYLDCERATTRELQWLIARSFARGVGDPELDGRFEPQALVVDADDGDGRYWRPLEADLLRLFEPINIERPSGPFGREVLCAESEFGSSWQALLAVGALPDAAPFPGRAAEVLFAPLEAVEFPVDAALHARYIANDEALRLIRRKIVDSDNAYIEESRGEHGPSSQTFRRPEEARELEDYLTTSERPPLLRAAISLCVSAPTLELLEERVERLKREYAPTKLHRPTGEQLRLFLSHLPAQPSRVRAYEDVLTVEQFGASVPIATHAVGSEVGLYLGTTLSGSSQPVLFDLTEASRTSRAPAVLCSGTLGSGKTITAELLGYQGFLAGSRVVHVDPKGDGKLHELVGSEHCEVIELTPDDRHHGMLDPLRIGPEDTRADLAYAFLLDILPAPVPPGQQTEIRRAVDQVAIEGGRTCGEVVDQLRKADKPEARAAGEAIEVHAGSGLLRLGFSSDGGAVNVAGRRQVTVLRIANLQLPSIGTPRDELDTAELTGLALLRLLATYALHLMGSDWTRHKTLIFDEAWALLATTPGRTLLDRINRLGRSQNATPILATQVLDDVEAIEPLIGAYLAFGVETESEAAKALTLLGVEPDDERLRQQLLAFRRGRCLFRDYGRRVSPVQVDPVDAAILDALDTRPVAGADGDGQPAGHDGAAAPTGEPHGGG